MLQRKLRLAVRPKIEIESLAHERLEPTDFSGPDQSFEFDYINPIGVKMMGLKIPRADAKRSRQFPARGRSPDPKVSK